MLKPKITLLPGHIQSVYVQNIIKLYANIIKRAEGQNGLAGVREVGEMLQEKLPIFIQSADLEVQERVRGGFQCHCNVIMRFHKVLLLLTLFYVCLLVAHANPLLCARTTGLF